MSDATELSGQEFGRAVCDRPEYAGVWVQFKTTGYPRKLRREWDAANADATLAIVLRYVIAWNVRDVDGADVALPDGERPAALMDNVDEAVIVWLIRAFARFWLVDLTAPRPNSSAPSLTTP